MKCLDTYALVEIHNGNPRFADLLNEKNTIPNLTLVEFYGYLYKKHNEKTADYWHRKLSFLCKPVSRETCIKAMKFKIDNKKEKLSFFDCVGYIYSQENNTDFVTGDKAFKGRPHTKFIPAK